MKISKQILIASVVVSIASISGIGYAKHKHHNDEQSKIIDIVQGTALDIDQAMGIALNDTPGKIVEAELEKDDGVVLWEIELVDNQNQLIEFEIDANSGEILEREIEDK